MVYAMKHLPPEVINALATLATHNRLLRDCRNEKVETHRHNARTAARKVETLLNAHAHDCRKAMSQAGEKVGKAGVHTITRHGKAYEEAEALHLAALAALSDFRKEHAALLAPLVSRNDSGDSTEWSRICWSHRG